MKPLFVAVGILGMVTSPLPAEEPKIRQTLQGHEGVVTAVAFSADGKLLASASHDKTVRLWDVVTGKHKATFEHSHHANCVTFSTDQKMVACGSARHDRAKERLFAEIILWDVGTSKKIETLEAEGSWVNAIVFTPDGKAMASASDDGTVTLWNMTTRKKTASFKEHRRAAWALAITKDGKTLASGGEDTTIILWDVVNNKRVRSVKLTKGVFGVAFSPDGTLLASADEDRLITLFDLVDTKPPTSLKGHTDWVRTVAFSPSGKTLASAGDDQTIKVWSVATKKDIATLTGHKDVVGSVAFSPDGKTLASAGGYDKTVKLWDMPPEK